MVVIDTHNIRHWCAILNNNREYISEQAREANVTVVDKSEWKNSASEVR